MTNALSLNLSAISRETAAIITRQASFDAEVQGYVVDRVNHATLGTINIDGVRVLKSVE